MSKEFSPHESVTLTLSDVNCMTLKSECNEPLKNLSEVSCEVKLRVRIIAHVNFSQFLMTRVLSSDRISAQSLGLVCITSAVEINLDILTSLESIVPFVEARDPKLRSSSTKVCTCVGDQIMCEWYPRVHTCTCDHNNEPTC